MIENLDSLEQQIPKWMARENVPGLSIALIQDAQLIWQSGFGVKDSFTREPVCPETVFQAASLSKPVFAYAVLQWCRERLVDLDAPLSALLPEPYIADDPRVYQITVRHVLSHTPGFPNWRPRDQPLCMHFAPGERFAYSGEGYLYLQKVIEHVTGLRLDAWIRSQLLNPLGMVTSSYVWMGEYEALAARGHDDQGIPQGHSKMTEPNAAYSLYTTPSEFARFVIALLEPPPGPCHLDRDQIAQMLTPQIAFNDAGFDAERPASEITPSNDVSWGLGWGLQHTLEGEAFWHWGDNGFFQALVMGLPRSRSAMVCMVNGENGQALWGDLSGAVFGGVQPAIGWLQKLYGKPKVASTMTIEEAAGYLQLHPLTARRLARQGALPAFKIGRQWRIKRALLDAWLVEHSLQNLA